MGRVTSAFARERLPYWLLTAALAAVLAPVLGGNFLWDDHALLLDNPLVQGLGRDNLKGMFLSAPNAAWQPLGWLAYALIHQAVGLSPAAYHLASLLLHILICVFLARLIAALPGKAPPWAAVSAALLYGLHPLQLPAAAWVAALPDQLCALFALWSVRAYIAKPGGRRELALSWLLFAASGLFRWKALALPAVLLIIDGALLKRRAWAEKLPFFAAAAMLAAANSWTKAAYAYELALQPAVLARGLLLFLWKTVWPAGLLPIYSLQSPDTMGWPGPAAVLAAGLVAAALWRQKKPAVWAAFATYAVFLLPPLLHHQNGVTLAFAHHPLLAVMPLYALLGAGLARLGRRGLLLGAALAAVFSLQTRASIPYWGDGELFWERAIALDPGCRAAYRNLAEELSWRGRNDEALFWLEAQLRYNPGDVSARAGARVLRNAGARARPPAGKKDIIGER